MSVAGRLTQALQRALQGTRHVAANPFLDFLRRAAADVESAESGLPALTPAIDELVRLASGYNFALDSPAVNDFIQKLGESNFWAMCHAKGLMLERVAQQRNTRTPDFRLPTAAGDVHFEVKTLSVVQCERGIDAALESAFAAQIDIERQTAAGARIATGISTIAPYGDKGYDGKPLTSVIDTLLEKVRGNIKQEQFALPDTFLVLDLGMLPPSRAERAVLRPVHWDTGLVGTPVTGELWMVAFGSAGMVIHSVPEFEGKPGVEGAFSKQGILVDPHFDFVSGLLFVVHPLSAPADLWGLFRAKDVSDWSNHAPHACEQVLALVDGAWNDDGDSLGFSLS